MKISAFIENLEKSDSVAGVECHLNGTSLTFNCAVLKKKKNKVDLVKVFTEEQSLDKIADFLGKGLPVILIVTGKSVLTRLVEVDENKSDSKVLTKLIPNANLNEFCIGYNHNLNSAANELHVSIIRKQALADIYEIFERNNLSVAGCLLGPFALENILSGFNFPAEYTLLASNHQFSISNNTISKYEKTEQEVNSLPVKINDAEVPGDTFLAYTAAMHYFYFGYSEFPVNSDFMRDQATEFCNRTFFFNAMKIGLFTIFGMLLLNFMVFQQFSNEVNEKNKQYEGLQEGVVEFTRLQSEYGQKFEFMKQNGLLTPPKASFYADRIAASLPDKIMLTSLKVYPLKEQKPGEDNGFHFENDKIIVSGNCKQSYELNLWIKLLNKFEWIDKVVVADFIQESPMEPGHFILEFKLK